MKIKYNLEYNYLNIYDETQGIVANKQSIYRNENRMIKSYTKEGLRFIKYAVIEFIFMIIFNLLPFPSLLSDFLNFIFAITVGGIVAYYIIFFSLYTMDRNRSHKGELQIDKEGILDISEDGVKIGIPWHYIECVIITDKVICFMSKVVASIVITTDHLEKVKEAINTYQDDLKVLDKRTIKREIVDHSLEIEEEQSEIIEETVEELEKKEEKKTEITKNTRKKKKEDIDQKIEDVEKAIKELTED